MLIINDLPPRFAKKKPRPKPVPPAGPVLVAAAYETGAYVDLTFDRPIGVAGFEPGVFSVHDAVADALFLGDGGNALLSPTTLRVTLGFDGIAGGDAITLSVGPDNGIVAVDDGTVWTGVSDLALPFGA
jgi:hypothetical protein